MSEISKTVKINIVGDVSSFNQSMESIETKYNQTKQSIETNGINPAAKDAMDEAGSLRYQKDFGKDVIEKYNTASVDVKSFLDPFFSSLQGVFQSLTTGLEKGSTKLSEQMEKATSKDVMSFTNQYKTNMAIAGALKKDMMDAMDIASSMQDFEREIYNKNKKSIASRVSSYMRTAEGTSKSKSQLTDQEVIEQLLGNDSGKSIRSALTSIGLESRDQQERALGLALKTEVSRYRRGTFTKAVSHGGQISSQRPVSLTDLVPTTHATSLLSGGLKKGAKLNTEQADAALDLAIYRQLQEQVAAGNNSVYKAMKQAGLLVQRPQKYENQYSHRTNGQRGGEIEWLSEKDLDTRMLDRTFGLLEAERKHAYESSPMWGRKVNDPDATAKLLKKEGTAIKETEEAVNLDTRKNSNPYIDAMTDAEYKQMLAGKSYYRSVTAPKAPKLSISEQMQIPNLRFAKDGSKLVAQSTSGSEYLNYNYQRKGVDLDDTKDEWSFVGTNPLLERIIALNKARKFGNREFGYGRDANDDVIKDTPYFFSQSLDDVYAKDRFGQIQYTQDPVTKKSRVELRPEMRELLDSVSGFGARKKAMSFTPQEGAAPIDLTSIVSKAESGGHIYWARTEDLNAIRKEDIDRFGFSMLDFFNEVDDEGRLIDKNGVVIDQNYQGKKSGQQIYAGQFDALGKILSHGENVAEHGGHTPLASVVDFDAMYEAFGKAGLKGPRGQVWGEDKFKFDGGGYMLPSVYGEDFQARMGPAKFLTQAFDFYDYFVSAGLNDFEGNVYAPGVGSGDVINEFSDLLKKRTSADALSADDEKRFQHLRDEYFTTLNRKNPQNIEMLIASSALKNVTKNESVSTGVYEKIRNFVGSNSGYGTGFSLGLDDEKIKARTKNGRVRLTPEDQTTILAIQSMMSGGLRMMKTDENYVDTQDFISPAFLSNTPVTQAMVEASNENYANAFAAHNSADPSLLINRLFKGQTKLDQRVRENPELLYTDEEARALVLQDLKTLENNQLNGQLYMPGRAHHMLGGANPTSVFALFETMTGKEINPDSVAAQLIAQSGEVSVVNPKTKGTGRGVWTRSPYAWAANFAGKFGSSEKMNEARKHFSMSDAAALFNVEDFYTLNTGDFDGDMAWFYELDDEQYLSELTRMNKAVRAVEANYNKEQATLKAAGRLPDRAPENDITWSGYFQRALGSTPGMGLGYKISQAQRVMDPKYASAYVKFAGNKIYGDAVDERKHGVGAGIAYDDALAAARSSGVTFDRLNQALGEEAEDLTKAGQTDILRFAMPMMHDVLGANILQQSMMGRLSPNGAGYGSDRAEAALRGVEVRYGNGNATKEEYDFAKWYAQIYGKRITGEQQILSDKDLAEGQQYLDKLEARVGMLDKSNQSEEAQRMRTSLRNAQGRLGEERAFGFTSSNVPYMGEQYADFMSREDRELFDAMVAEQERLSAIAKAEQEKTNIERLAEQYGVSTSKDSLEQVRRRVYAGQRYANYGWSDTKGWATDYLTADGLVVGSLAHPGDGKPYLEGTANEGKVTFQPLDARAKFGGRIGVALKEITGQDDQDISAYLGSAAHKVMEVFATDMMDQQTNPNKKTLDEMVADALAAFGNELTSTDPEAIRKQKIMGGHFEKDEKGHLSFVDDNKALTMQDADRAAEIRSINKKLALVNGTGGVQNPLERTLRDFAATGTFAMLEGQRLDDNGKLIDPLGTHSPLYISPEGYGDITRINKNGEKVSAGFSFTPDVVIKNEDGTYSIADYKSSGSSAKESVFQQRFYAHNIEELAKKGWEGDKNYEWFKRFINPVDKDGNVLSEYGPNATGWKTNIKSTVGVDMFGSEKEQRYEIPYTMAAGQEVANMMSRAAHAKYEDILHGYYDYLPKDVQAALENRHQNTERNPLAPNESSEDYAITPEAMAAVERDINENVAEMMLQGKIESYNGKTGVLAGGVDIADDKSYIVAKFMKEQEALDQVSSDMFKKQMRIMNTEYSSQGFISKQKNALKDLFSDEDFERLQDYRRIGDVPLMMKDFNENQAKAAQILVKLGEMGDQITETELTDLPMSLSNIKYGQGTLLDKNRSARNLFASIQDDINQTRTQAYLKEDGTYKLSKEDYAGDKGASGQPMTDTEIRNAILVATEESKVYERRMQQLADARQNFSDYAQSMFLQEQINANEEFDNLFGEKTLTRGQTKQRASVSAKAMIEQKNAEYKNLAMKYRLEADKKDADGNYVYTAEERHAYERSAEEYAKRALRLIDENGMNEDIFNRINEEELKKEENKVEAQRKKAGLSNKLDDPIAARREQIEQARKIINEEAEQNLLTFQKEDSSYVQMKTLESEIEEKEKAVEEEKDESKKKQLETELKDLDKEYQKAREQYQTGENKINAKKSLQDLIQENKSSYIDYYESAMKERSAFTIENALSGSAMTKDQYVLNNSLLTKANIEKQIQDEAQSGMITEDQQAAYLKKLNSSEFANLLDERGANQYDAARAREARQLDDYIYQNSRRGTNRQMRFSGGQIGRMANQTLMQNESELRQRQSDALYFSSQIKEKTTARKGLDPKKDAEQYNRLTSEINKLTEAEKENNTAMSELESHGKASAVFDSVSESVTKLMASFGKKMFRQALTEAKQFIKQFDQSMTNIQMITQKTDTQMSKLGDGFIKKAKDLKTSVSSVTAAATDLYRQGLDDDEVNTRIDDIIKFSTVAGIKSDVASKIVTTAVNNNLVGSSQEAIDPLVALGDTAATTAAELAKGLQKSAGTANIAGVDYAELLSLLTIGTSKTQLGGNVIGTALNTIFSRLMKTANGDIAIDENGNRVSQSDVATSLKAAGIDIYETGTNKMRGAFDILSQLSTVWDTLDDTTRSNIAYNVAGTRQRNNFETLMAGLSDEDLMEQYMNTAKGSSGSTNNKYKNYAESLAAANALLTASFDELVASVTETDGFVGFTDFLSGALQGVTEFNEELGGMPGKIVALAAAGTALVGVINVIGKTIQGGGIGKALAIFELIAGGVAVVSSIAGNIIKTNKENKENEKHKEQNTLEENIANQQQRNTDVNKKISEAEKLNKEIQDTKKEFVESGKEMNADDIADLTLKAKDLNSVLLELGVSSSDLDFKIDAESLQSWDDLTDKIKEAKDGYEQIKLDTIRTNSEQAMKAIDEKFKNGEVSFGQYQDVTRATFNEAGGWTGIARYVQQQGSDMALGDYMFGVKEGTYKDDLAKILYSLYGFEDKDYEMFNKKTGEVVSSNVDYDTFMENITDMDYAFRYAKDTANGKKGDYLNYFNDFAKGIIDQLVTGEYAGDLNSLYLNATSGENAVAQKTIQDLYKEYYEDSFASSGVDNKIVENLWKMNARKTFNQMPDNFISMKEEEQRQWFNENAINPFEEYVTSDMGELSFDYGKYFDEYLSSGVENPYETVTIKSSDGGKPITIPGKLLSLFLSDENQRKMFNEEYANGNVEMKLTEKAAIIDEEQKRAQLTDIDNTYKKNKKKNIDDLIELGNVINASVENEGRLPTITEMQEAGIEDVTTLMNSQAEFNNAYLRATNAEDATMTSDRFKTISDLIVAKQTGLTRNLTQEEAQRIIDLTEGMSAKERAEFFAADLSSVEQEAMKSAGFGEYFTESGNMTEEEMQDALDKLKLNEASLKDIAGYTENFGNISSYLTDTSAKGRMDTLAAMALSDAKLSEVQTAAENILSGNMSEGDVRKLAEYYGKDYETFMSNQGLMSSYAELAQGTVSNKDTAKALFKQMTGMTYDQWKDFENLSNEDFISKYGEDAFAAAYEGIDDTASNIMDIIEAEATTETPLSQALSQSQSARLQKAMPGYLGGLTGGTLEEAKASIDALAADADKFKFANANIDGFAEAFVDLNNAIEADDLKAAQEALKKIDDMKFMGLKEISDADVFNKIKDISTLADLESLQLEDAQMYQRVNEVTGGYMLKRAQAKANGEDTSIYDALINDAIANYKISKNTIDNQMLINKGVVSSDVNNWTEMMRNGRAGEVGTSVLTSINGSRNKQAIYNKLAAGKTLTREEQEYLAGQYNIDMDMYGASAGFYNGIFQEEVARERARTEAGLAEALNDQTDVKARTKAIEDLRNLGYEVTSNKETGKYNVSAASLYNGLTFDKQGVFTSAEILQAAQQALDQEDWTGIGEDLQKAVESNYKDVAEYLSYNNEQKISPSGQAVLKAAKDQLTQDAATTLLDQTAEYYSESKSAYDIFATGTGKQRLDYAQNIMSQATNYANAQQALSSLDTNKAFEELDSTKLDYIEGVTGWGKNQIKKMWESDPSNAKKILADSMKDSMETISASLEGALTKALGSDLKTLGTMNTTELANKIRDFDENLANLIEALSVSLTGGKLKVAGAEAETTTLDDVITERKRQYVNQSNMMDTLEAISSGSVWWNKMGKYSDDIRAEYEQALVNNPEIDNIDQATLDILNKALGGERLTTEEQGALDTFIESYQKKAKRNLEYKRAEGIDLTAEEEEYEALQRQRELEGQEGLNDVDRAQLQRRAYESMMNGTYGKTFGISDEAMMNDIMSGNAKLAMFGVATAALEEKGSSMSEYLDLAALEERTPEQAARFAELNEIVGGLNLTFSDFNDVATSLAGETLANLIEQEQLYGETSNQVADFVRKFTGTIDDQANALNDLYTQERKVQQLNSVMKAFESGSANKEFDSMFSGYSKQQRAQMLKEGKESLQYKNLEKQRENAQHAYGQMLGQGASDYFKKSMGDGQQLVENLGGEAMDLEVPMTFNIKGGVITNVDMSAFDDGGDADVAAAAEELKDAGMARIQEFLSQAGFVGNAVLKLVVNESANGDTAAIDVAVEADSTADTTGNPSSGGGGGGGGKSSADLLIEKQQKASKLYEHKMKRLQTKAEDYEQLGEYTNLNEVLQTENDMMKRRMPDVKKNIKQLKQQMKHTKMGSDDWHKLRDALFAAEEEYDNLTKEIHANNRAMEENKKKILETYLALEEAASSALEAEEQKRREMISSRAQMEQQIFGDIQTRYQKEWD